jgi:hypothetical protein
VSHNHEVDSSIEEKKVDSSCVLLDGVGGNKVKSLLIGGNGSKVALGNAARERKNASISAEHKLKFVSAGKSKEFSNKTGVVVEGRGSDTAVP